MESIKVFASLTEKDILDLCINCCPYLWQKGIVWFNINKDSFSPTSPCEGLCWWFGLSNGQCPCVAAAVARLKAQNCSVLKVGTKRHLSKKMRQLRPPTCKSCPITGWPGFPNDSQLKLLVNYKRQSMLPSQSFAYWTFLTIGGEEGG